MIIENPEFVIKYNKSRYFIFIIGIVAILLFSFVDIDLGLPKEVYIATSVVIFLGINLYRFLKDYNYVQVSIQKEKLIVRYYVLRPLSENRKSIEIPVNTFVKYEIVNAMGGLVPRLVLYQRIKGKVAKYPGVSLSAYTKQDIKNLKLLLNSIKPSKN